MHDDPNRPSLRNVLVRERLVAGDSDEGVIDYIVARYAVEEALREKGL